MSAIIEQLATRLAVSIKEASPDRTSSVDVMKFSLIILINAMAITLLTMAVGAVTGKFLATCITLFCFAFLRFFTGGLHLKSSEACVVFSTALLAVIPHLPLSSFTLEMTIGSLLLVLLLAPSQVEQHHKLAQRSKRLYKLIASLIVSTNFFIQSDIVAQAFLVQSLLLIPLMKGGEMK